MGGEGGGSGAQRAGWAHGNNAEDGWGDGCGGAQRMFGFHTDAFGAHRCNIGNVLMEHA